MKKYIRTDKGVFEIVKEDETEIYYFEKEEKVKNNDYYATFISKTKNLLQSDNLAKLCDEFVLKTTSKESGKSYYGLYYFTDIKHFQVKEGYKGTWYGAIWTDKGLIYVAKMNEDGELVLL